MTRLKELVWRLRFVLAYRILPKWPQGGGMAWEGERTTWTMANDGTEWMVIVQPKGYDTFGRESTYRLLRIVRLNERRMGWRCPEPPLPPAEPPATAVCNCGDTGKRDCPRCRYLWSNAS